MPFFLCFAHISPYSFLNNLQFVFVLKVPSIIHLNVRCQSLDSLENGDKFAYFPYFLYIKWVKKAKKMDF